MGLALGVVDLPQHLHYVIIVILSTTPRDKQTAIILAHMHMKTGDLDEAYMKMSAGKAWAEIVEEEAAKNGNH